MADAGARGHKITPEKRSAFLCALAEVPSVTRACAVAGIGRRAAYKARDRSAAFAQQWDAALREGIQSAAGEGWRRGVEGVAKPVYQGGQRVGQVQEYSDTLLIFMLKCHDRETYGDKAVSLEALRDYTERVAEVVVTFVPEGQRDACRRAILALPLRG